MQLIYLACPYAHADAEVRKARYESVTKATAWLMEHEGSSVYSPITHNHHTAIAGGLPLTHDFWLPRDIRILRMCDRMTILMLDGWEKSKGVEMERQTALAAQISINYVDPEDVGAIQVSC